MERILFFVFLLPLLGFSQEELWPTSNAEWHYGIQTMLIDGYNKIKIDRDTIINNRSCQIYSSESKWKNTTIPIYKDSVFHEIDNSFFILSLEDSVLSIFNKYRSQFDTIFNFKAEIGDYWRSYQNIEVCGDDTNAHILIEVTGKSTEIVNGRNLLKFETKKIAVDSGGVEFSGATDVFYQGIGSWRDYFVPRFCYGSIDAISSLWFRCFTKNKGLSDEFFYQRVDYDCEKLLDVKKENLMTKKITVVNPVVDGIIKVIGINIDKIQSIRLFNNVDQELSISINSEQEKLIIQSKSDLQSGFYYCVFTHSNGIKQIEKIVVQN